MATGEDWIGEKGRGSWDARFFSRSKCVRVRRWLLLLGERQNQIGPSRKA